MHVPYFPSIVVQLVGAPPYQGESQNFVTWEQISLRSIIIFSDGKYICYKNLCDLTLIFLLSKYLCDITFIFMEIDYISP